MTGYQKNDWLNSTKFWLQIMNPEDREIIWNNVTKIYKTGKEGIYQYRWIKKNGEEIWVESHSTPIKDNEGQNIGLRGVTMDITERKRIEEDLKKSKEQLSVIFENVANGITVQDSYGKVIFMNN